MANTLTDGRACSICQVHKPAQDFPRSRQTKTGLHPQCKACRAAKRKADPDRKAKDRASYERNRERILQRAKDKYAADPEPHRAASRKNYTDGGGRDRYMRRTFGISEAEYEVRFQAQGGLCAICGKAESNRDHRTGAIRALAVDHDHASGVVRGLLCRKCNTAIGLLGDTAESVGAAVRYLRGEV